MAKVEREEREHGEQRVGDRPRAKLEPPPRDQGQHSHRDDQRRSIAEKERAERDRCRLGPQRKGRAGDGLRVAEKRPEQHAEQKQRGHPVAAPAGAGHPRATLAPAKSRERKQQDDEDAREGVIDVRDVADQRQSHEPRRRDDAEDEERGRARGHDQRAKDRIAEQRPRPHQRPERAEQHKKIGRGVRVVFAINGLPVEQIVEEPEEKRGLNLVGARDLAGRP